MFPDSGSISCIIQQSHVKNAENTVEMRIVEYSSNQADKVLSDQTEIEIVPMIWDREIPLPCSICIALSIPLVH
jgi:hypothetical protein